MPPSPIPSVQVTFISLDDHDDIPERVIVFGPNSEPVPVGRSSKNANKGLGASASNAFIDSPVVSRNHALITANATGTVSNVFVKDTGSMHGTLVNEVELERNLEHRLHSGDTLQFGVDVERGQDTFVAKKFRVEHRLARPVSIAPPFSRGFSVPELESEEDENIEDDHSMLMTSARHPRYGSQAHPVNVDDFDDLPAEELEGRFFESPPVAIAKSRSETAQTGKSSPYASPVPVAAGIFSTIIGESQHFLVADGNDAQDSDDEEAMMDLQDDTTSVHSSEADAGNSDDAASLSGDESIHDSDADSSDESEASNDSVDEDQADDEGFAVVHEQKPVNQVQVSPPPAPALPAMTTPPKFNISSPATLFKNPEPVVFGAGQPTAYSWSCTGSSLPRPAAPKPISWAQAPPRELLNVNNPWFEDMGIPSIFSDYRGDGLLNGTPSKAEPPRYSAFFDQPPEVFEAPPALFSPPPMAAAKEDASSGPSPFRRTKLSIPEIVEAVQEAPAPEQPPTPVSVTSRKRKADVLDEEVEVVASVTVPKEAEAVPEPNITETIPAIVVQVQAERPKKKLRTVLRYAATAMAGLAVGVVGVTTTLVALPEGFFQP